MALPGLSPRSNLNLERLAPRNIRDIIKIVAVVAIVMILLVAVAAVFGTSSEGFEDDIEPNKQEYDDALEKRIAESKETPRFDAELLLDVNRPYKADKPDFLGWWGDVIMGKTNPDIYHRKDAKSWIWPY